MFFTISKVFSFIIKPTFWILILLICCLIIKKRRKRIILLTLIVFYILTNNFIVDFIYKSWELEKFTLKSKFDIGIVLGGVSDYNKSDDTYNFNEYADRLMEAERLYHENIINKILLSGGNGMLINNGYNEANSMREYLLKKNISANDIIIENKSRNTKENAIFTSKILKEKYNNNTILLITSSSHMRRAKLSFEKCNINVVPFQTDCINHEKNTNISYLIMPDVHALKKWEIIIKEIIGYCVYKITL
ncbi:MAG: hypothetical protein CMP51_06905 [Flavobacteriales bacterium]|nr:hypothetical protein [Flavobacteriales bacterium]